MARTIDGALVISSTGKVVFSPSHHMMASAKSLPWWILRGPETLSAFIDSIGPRLVSQRGVTIYQITAQEDDLNRFFAEACTSAA